MQPNHDPRLPTYAEATRTQVNHSHEHYPTTYPAYTNPIPPYTTSELPNYSHPPSVPLYQYENNQLPTNTPAAQRIHIITEIVPQSRSVSCTRRHGIFWGIVFGLLIFAGILRVIVSHNNREY
ncbi:uncharacterized protein LOC141528569 [Cotesia typhae]|uniref:uncharacterized protein LOC141528569 n=1 Tax=Cotesia typhae TaxID=2053667 RepID=UPI003D6967FE